MKDSNKKHIAEEESFTDLPSYSFGLMKTEPGGSRIKMSEIRRPNLKLRHIAENSGDNGLSENEFLNRISVQACKRLGDLIKHNQTL